MPVRYKIVTGKNRRSFTSHQLPAKFVLKYPKGATVKAVPNTLGIMTFKTKKQAQNFLEKFQVPSIDIYGRLVVAYNNSKIIKVQGIGKGKKYAGVVSLRNKYRIRRLKNGKTRVEWEYKEINEIMDKLLKANPHIDPYSRPLPDTWRFPEGTVCYDKVKVLE